MVKTIGDGLFQSNKVTELISELVKEVEKHSQEISGVRAPNPERTLHLKKLGENIARVRGRPLLYPYVGTGLGRGPYVELEDGSVKLDFINGIGIHIMGHSHLRLIEAAVRGG